MRYPKQWKAEPESLYCASSKTKDTEREYLISLRVYRPGTVDHERSICAKLTYGQLLRLSKQIEAQLAHNDDKTLGGLTV
jgi:hypothetical protein